jgi:hypothetical protein
MPDFSIDNRLLGRPESTHGAIKSPRLGKFSRYGRMNRNKISTKSTANSLQINRFVHVGIPIFLSGYGGKTHRSREFHDTTALYSQQTTLNLSGGCVYEFLGGSNSYGLVNFRGPNGETPDSATQLLIEMLLKDGDTESVAYLTGLS